jgi:hypothetical protein
MSGLSEVLCPSTDSRLCNVPQTVIQPVMASTEREAMGTYVAMSTSPFGYAEQHKCSRASGWSQICGDWPCSTTRWVV